MIHTLTTFLDQFDGQKQRHPVLLWDMASAEVLDASATTAKPRTSAVPSSGRVLILELAKAQPGSEGVVLGRSRSCDVVLMESSVSRAHARFTESGGKWSLADLGSSNGTWVGERKLRPNEPAALEDKSTLKFGSVALTFLLPDAFAAYVNSLRGGD